jgi:cyclopropane-fatty-acyl-phospholipid synthase
MATGVELAEAGLVPDWQLRAAIRRLCATRADAERELGRTGAQFAEQMSTAPIATHTELANQQHYEVPTELFRKVLGPAMKYSACVYDGADLKLEEAERRTLDLTCARAGIEDGMRVLDLGCGWGSFTTHVAERYPNCQITAVSNSSTQREFIEQRCDQPGWADVEVITTDAARFDLGCERFDRVVSVEMFEHMRNWGLLFDRIAAALMPDGAFFMHVFCHRTHPYFFEDEGEPDWMARNFFSGGIMPSFDLPHRVKSALAVESEWQIDGRDYARTLRAWLDRLDACRPEIDTVFANTLAPREARRAVQRWRMFFMACEELFAFNEGSEWFVGHYLLRPHAELRRSSASRA